MREHGLTSASTLDDYDGAKLVTRRDMLGVLRKYAEQQDMKWIEGSDCTFSDIADLGEQEQADIQDVCSYEFLRGTNGAFRPDAEMNQAEMLAMVIRGNYGYLNEYTDPWYYEYYQKAVSLGLVKPGLDLDLLKAPLTKEDVAKWLQTADHIKSVDASTFLVE